MTKTSKTASKTATKSTATKAVPTTTKQAVKPLGEERNGIRPPVRAGVVMSIWLTFEEMPKLSTADLPKLAEESGWSLTLTRSWHRQWRKWHNLPVGKTTAPVTKRAS